MAAQKFSRWDGVSRFPLKPTDGCLLLLDERNPFPKSQTQNYDGAELFDLSIYSHSVPEL